MEIFVIDNSFFVFFSSRCGSVELKDLLTF